MILPFVTRNGTGQTLVEIFDPAWAAYQERARIQKAIDDFEPTSFADIGGTFAGFSEVGLEHIRALYSRVYASGRFWVRTYDSDGSRWSLDGKWGIDSNFRQINSDGSETKLQFPWPNGWTRKWPRSIFSLSQVGTGRVRFEVYGRFGAVNQPFFCCPIGSTYYNVDVHTPDEERQHSGKFFRRVSEAWVLDDDQDSPVEIMTEQVPASLAENWVPKSGEYFGDHNLNDLTRAIQQLRCYSAALRSATLGVPVPRTATWIPIGTNLIANGEDKQRGGPLGLFDERDPTAVAANYSSHTTTAITQLIGVYSYVFNAGVPDPSYPNDYRYYMQGTKDALIYAVVGTDVGSLSCKTEVWMVPDSLSDGGYNSDVYDDFGRGFVQGAWNKMGEKYGPFRPATFLDPDPIQIGWVDGTPPDLPALPPKGKANVRGWVATWAVILFDFTDEFTYN